MLLFRVLEFNKWRLDVKFFTSRSVSSLLGRWIWILSQDGYGNWKYSSVVSFRGIFCLECSKFWVKMGVIFYKKCYLLWFAEKFSSRAIFRKFFIREVSKNLLVCSYLHKNSSVLTSIKVFFYPLPSLIGFPECKKSPPDKAVQFWGSIFEYSIFEKFLNIWDKILVVWRKF